MNFEEMQVIWDSQEEQPMYAFDLDAMHREVQRKAGRIERAVSVTELSMIALMFVVAGAHAADPVLDGTHTYKFFGSAVLLMVAAWMWGKRVRRLKGEVQYEASLRGDIDRSLSQVNYHLGLANGFRWWFLMPAALIFITDMSLADSGPTAMRILVAVGSIALAFGLASLEPRCVHLPNKRALESLKAKLLSEN
ncbi:MAG: hypothetical protein ACI8QC_002309 [Planctomycetota bacterium]|jgi:hypothetical protein